MQDQKQLLPREVKKIKRIIKALNNPINSFIEHLQEKRHEPSPSTKQTQDRIPFTKKRTSNPGQRNQKQATQQSQRRNSNSTISVTSEHAHKLQVLQQLMFTNNKPNRLPAMRHKSTQPTFKMPHKTRQQDFYNTGLMSRNTNFVTPDVRSSVAASSNLTSLVTTQGNEETRKRNLKSQTIGPKKANPKMLLEKIPTRARVPSEGVESFGEDSQIIDLKIKMPRLDLDALGARKIQFEDDMPEQQDLGTRYRSPVDDYSFNQKKQDALQKNRRSSKKLLTQNVDFQAIPLSTRSVRKRTEIIYEQKIPNSMQPPTLRVISGKLSPNSPRFLQSQKNSARLNSSPQHSPRSPQQSARGQHTGRQSGKSTDRQTYQVLVDSLYKLERTNFFICHNKPNQELDGANFHFHEYIGPHPTRHLCGDQFCKSGQPGVYGPLELAMEAAKAKVNNDYQRFTRIRPVLLMYRGVIEAEMRRKDQGMKPAPDVVIDKLLIKMKSSNQNKSDQTRFEKLVHTFQCQTQAREVIDQPSSPIQSMQLILPPVLTPVDKLVLGLSQQPKCNSTISDWKQVPVHKVIMENMSEMQAIKSCYADFSIFYYFGRLEDPSSSPEQALQNVFKLNVKSTELDYLVMLSKKRDSDEAQQVQWFQQANLTYMTLMMLLGQAKTYDYVISQYKSQITSNLEDTVIKMLTRCQLTHRVYEQCRVIFKTLKNHKSTVKKLQGLEDTDSVQQMADFFSRQTSKLFQHINCFLKEASHHTTLGHNLNEFTYGGNDLKQVLRSDMTNVRDQLGERIQLKMLDEAGRLIQ